MHIKIAKNDYPIVDLLRNRWSPRAFNGQPIENEKLQSLFEAARWTASSSNLQPWFFIVGMKGDETYEKIKTTLVEFNLLWAPTAPVLFLAIAKTTNPKDKPNNSAQYDLGQSIASLSLQATDLGLFVHQMGGFDAAEAARLFEIPSDYAVATVVAVGYPGNPDILHENLKKMEISPRERRMASDSVFSGKFGQHSDIFNQ